MQGLVLLNQYFLEFKSCHSNTYYDNYKILVFNLNYYYANLPEVEAIRKDA